MTERFVTRGFVGRRGAQGPGQPTDVASRIPPGQYLTTDFPVLSAGPTPRTPLDRWSFSIEGLVREPVSWTWESFLALPSREWTVDISCVTKWTKLDMHWRGDQRRHVVRARRSRSGRRLRDRLVGWRVHDEPAARGHPQRTGVRRVRVRRQTTRPEHGGPARLVVPGRYFWKSAKWVRGLRLQSHDEPGFWESLGYHNRGDQWLEERYSGD